MLGSVIRNSAIFVGVMVVAVILLRDNTQLFTVGATGPQTARLIGTERRTDNDRRDGARESSEEELLRKSDESSDEALEEREPEPPEEPEKEQSEQSTPEQMVINAGPGGHFFIAAEVDGNEVGFLVDTGATMVALSLRDAENLGLSADQLDYTGRANTANGVARFAPVVLSEVAIGDLVIHDVKAVVMESPMDVSLLGMTFLNRLAGFEVKDNQLIMRW